MPLPRFLSTASRALSHVAPAACARVSGLPLAGTGRTPLTVKPQATVARGASGVAEAAAAAEAAGAAEVAGATGAEGAPEHADADNGTIADSTATMTVLRHNGPQASRMA